MIAIIRIIISALMWARAFAETILYYIRLYNSTVPLKHQRDLINE